MNLIYLQKNKFDLHKLLIMFFLSLNIPVTHSWQHVNQGQVEAGCRGGVRQYSCRKLHWISSKNNPRWWQGEHVHSLWLIKLTCFIENYCCNSSFFCSWSQTLIRNTANCWDVNVELLHYFMLQLRNVEIQRHYLCFSQKILCFVSNICKDIKQILTRREVVL